MQFKLTPLMLALAGLASTAMAETDAPRKLDAITITGGRPTSLPTQIPTVIEGLTGEQVEERINALDSEDALKYFPSLNVRKRYTGDYDHAVLASRASGTQNSARSLVYADGILLSNLLGNGATFTPRWGLVAPEEIERVDVLYGPFSAAYPGNSVGAVVDFQTRMPQRFEAHAKLAGFTQHFAQYGSNDRYSGGQGSASIGDRNGAWSWWVDLSRMDSNGQPIAFANRLVSSGVPGKAGVPVTGAVADRNPFDKDWVILGGTSQAQTVQDHAKVKLAYDLSPTLRASYTLGWWKNDATRNAESYLRDGAGQAVVVGAVNIDGRRYDLKASDFAPTVGDLEHVMHGLSLKTHARGEWDWEFAASRYDYARDMVRTPTTPVLNADTAAPGNVTDMGGSGWHTLALKAVWRPSTAHLAEFGLQDDGAALRTLVYAGADWRSASSGALVSTFNGNTRLQSLFAQDTWQFAPQWRATLGLRHEHWRADGGSISSAATPQPLAFAERSETAWSPKAALGWQAAPDWSIKVSTGRAVRNPTAAELFQGSIVDGAIVNRDPNLRAEKSWTSELTAERMTESGSLRATLFHETTRDALYSQPLTATVNTVQNIGRIRTRGAELVAQEDDALLHGLSLMGSVTWAHSIIEENAGFAASVGKWQPRVPRWRANTLASMRFDARWSATLAARYSGKQYGSLDNSDPHGDTYTGVSQFMVADLRVRYRFTKQWTASVGVDNLGKRSYWAYHPYTQRTFIGELQFDL